MQSYYDEAVAEQYAMSLQDPGRSAVEALFQHADFTDLTLENLNAVLQQVQNLAAAMVAAFNGA